MDWLKDILVGGGLTLLVGVVTTFLISLAKKGNFESWGISAGKWLSKIGRLRLGKSAWEKLEDVLTFSVLSFAAGLKKGADFDDKNGDSVPEDDKGSGR